MLLWCSQAAEVTGLNVTHKHTYRQVYLNKRKISDDFGLFRVGHEHANSEKKYRNTLKDIKVGFELRHA
jgi:hypothetical protein